MELYSVWPISGLRKGLELRVEAFASEPAYSCAGGLRRMYEIVDSAGNIVTSGVTCGCGRGCCNYDCIRDEWGYHDTDIEEYRDD